MPIIRKKSQYNFICDFLNYKYIELLFLFYINPLEVLITLLQNEYLSALFIAIFPDHTNGNFITCYYIFLLLVIISFKQQFNADFLVTIFLANSILFSAQVSSVAHPRNPKGLIYCQCFGALLVNLNK